MKVAWWRTWPGRGWRGFEDMTCVWPFHSSLQCIAMIWITIENPPTRDFPELPVEVKIVWLHAFKYLVGILHLKLRSWHLPDTLAKSGTTSSSSMYFNMWMPEIILANFNYRWGCAYGATCYMLNSMEKIDHNFVVPNPRNFVLKPTLSQDFAGILQCAVWHLKHNLFCSSDFRSSWSPFNGSCEDLDEEMDCMDVPHWATKCDSVQTVDVHFVTNWQWFRMVQMHYGHLWPSAHGTEWNW